MTFISYKFSFIFIFKVIIYDFKTQIYERTDINLGGKSNTFRRKNVLNLG